MFNSGQDHKFKLWLAQQRENTWPNANQALPFPIRKEQGLMKKDQVGVVHHLEQTRPEGSVKIKA